MLKGTAQLLLMWQQAVLIGTVSPAVGRCAILTAAAAQLPSRQCCMKPACSVKRTAGAQMLQRRAQSDSTSGMLYSLGSGTGSHSTSGTWHRWQTHRAQWRTCTSTRTGWQGCLQLARYASTQTAAHGSKHNTRPGWATALARSRAHMPHQPTILSLMLTLWWRSSSVL